MNCYYYYYYEYCILCVSCLLYKVKRISYDYLIIFVRLDSPAKPQTSTKNNNITDTPNLYPILPAAQWWYTQEIRGLKTDTATLTTVSHSGDSYKQQVLYFTKDYGLYNSVY